MTVRGNRIGSFISCAVAAGCVIVPAARGEDFEWTGNFSNSFGSTLNWSPVGIPDGPSDTATFNTASGYTVELSADHGFDQLFFTTGNGTFTSAGGSWAMNLSDSFEMSGGLMTLQSTSVNASVSASVLGQLNVNGATLSAMSMSIGNAGTGQVFATNGVVSAQNLTVGLDGGNGTLSVSGLTAELDVPQVFMMSSDGTQSTMASLTIAQGATATVQSFQTFFNESFVSSTTDVLLNSDGTSLTVQGNIFRIGYPESAGTSMFRINGGAELDCFNFRVESNGELQLNDGTIASNGDTFLVRGGTFTRASGTTFTTPSAYDFTVDEEGQLDWALSNNFGETGSADWFIESGATAEVSDGWRIGQDAGTSGTTTVDSDFNLSPERSTLRSEGGGAGADIYVGNDGHGELTVLNGSLVDFGDDCVVASEMNSSGIITVSGATSAFRSTLDVTRNGNGAVFNLGRFGNADGTISDGALVKCGGDAPIGNGSTAMAELFVGGTMNGYDATLEVGDDLLIGGGTTSGGVASVVVDDGGFIDVTDALYLWLDDALFLGSGGQLDAGGVFHCRGDAVIEPNAVINLGGDVNIRDGGTLALGDQIDPGAVLDTPASVYVGGFNSGADGAGDLTVRAGADVRADEVVIWEDGTAELRGANAPTPDGRISVFSGVINNGTFFGEGEVRQLGFDAAGQRGTSSMINNGDLHVGVEDGVDSIGILRLTQTDLQLNATGVLHIEVGPAGNDRIDGDSQVDVALGGALEVTFTDGFEPQASDEFLITQIALGQGVHINGDFDAIIEPPGYELGIEVTDTQVVLKVFCVPCAGDLEPDLTVDVFDLFVLLNNWGTDGAGADLAPPNDVVDVFDLFELLGAWGNCSCIQPG